MLDDCWRLKQEREEGQAQRGGRDLKSPRPLSPPSPAFDPISNKNRRITGFQRRFGNTNRRKQKRTILQPPYGRRQEKNLLYRPPITLNNLSKKAARAARSEKQRFYAVSVNKSQLSECGSWLLFVWLRIRVPLLLFLQYFCWIEDFVR